MDFNLIKSVHLDVFNFQILMIVILARVKTTEHVLTELATTLALAYLDFKGQTVVSVRYFYSFNKRAQLTVSQRERFLV